MTNKTTANLTIYATEYQKLIRSYDENEITGCKFKILEKYCVCIHVFTDQHNGYTAQFLGFSIIVSNTTDIRHGVVCFRETEDNRSTIPAVFDIDCHETGRYVFYYNERIPSFGYPHGYSEFAHADICEIEVYGTLDFSYVLTWKTCGFVKKDIVDSLS